jgi:microcystin-dependent protein
VSNPFIGEIRMFAGNFAPSGWAFCNGALMPISENDALFTLIGTTYGGDGQSTFALPNLQSRVPVHQGPGFQLAQAGGVETVTLATTQVASHTHVPQANSSAAGVADPTGAIWGGAASNIYTSAVPDGSVTMAPNLLSSVGGGQPHDNLMPFTAVNFILSLFGIFPSQT